MRLSNRITGLTGGGSDGWDVFYRARRMKAAGAPVIELTIGEHDIRTDRAILEAMHAAAMAGHTGYAEVPGIRPLREAIARRVEARTGVPTGLDNVLVTAGGQAGLFAAHAAVCDPGDVALFCDPYYATYPGTIRGVSAVPRAIVTRPDTAFQPTARDFAAAAPGARSLLINTPNNPTGAVWHEETLCTVAEACTAHGLWLISDEVYETQVWEGRHLSPRALPGMAERTLVIGSMSKSHAMTGSRIGWIVGPEAAISHLINLSTHTTYGVPGYIQDAALFALEAGPELEDRIAAPFRRRRDMVLERLEGHPVIGHIPAEGGMYVMLDIRATGLSGSAFAERLLDEEHIAVMPGESFGQAAAGHLRVALTRPDEELAEAMGRLIGFAERRARDAA